MPPQSQLGSILPWSVSPIQINCDRIHRMKASPSKITLFTALIVVLTLCAFLYWHHETYYPSTDDAYIQANIVNIAPRVTGQVSKIYVKNDQYIQKGQRLFDIDPTPFKDSLDQALANLDETTQQVSATTSAVSTARSMLIERQAQLLDTEKESARTLELVKEKLFPASAGDKARSDLSVAKAAVAAAQSQLQEAEEKLGHADGTNASIRVALANVKQAQLNLGYTQVTAPHDGYIANFTLRAGDPVTAYQELFALVENNTFWADSNFKETDIARIQPGQPAIVIVDMYPGITFHGIVSTISTGSGTTFELLPPENATGNWVKVTQRFPVRVDITDRDPNHPLRVGASAEVTIDTHTQAVK